MKFLSLLLMHYLNCTHVQLFCGHHLELNECKKDNHPEMSRIDEGKYGKEGPHFTPKKEKEKEKISEGISMELDCM